MMCETISRNAAQSPVIMASRRKKPVTGVKSTEAQYNMFEEKRKLLARYTYKDTGKPVIGIPIKTSDLGGMDSLLSIVQMPSGIPVATVAINGSANAALLAVQMLALSDPALAEKVANHRQEQAQKVLDDNESL